MLDIIAAVNGAVIGYHEGLAERRRAAAELEEDQWFDTTILPLLSPEQAAAMLSERQRLRQRREDIRRQERQHRERLAVESRKASALESQARNRDGGFWRGFFLGRIGS